MPRFPETHALFGDWTVHAESLPLFLFGYAVANRQEFWQRIEGWRWFTLVAALACLALELGLRAAGRYLSWDEIPAAWLHVPWGAIERLARAAYTWTALLAIFGWGRVLLNRPFRWLPYATEAVYPVVHPAPEPDRADRVLADSAAAGFGMGTDAGDLRHDGRLFAAA